MEAAAVEMRAAFFEIRQETGGLVSAQAVKAEIEEMKESESLSSFSFRHD